MTKHSHSPYTSTYSSTPHNTNRKHNIHHIPTQTDNILQHSKAKTLFLTTAATQPTFPQTPHSHYNRHKTNMRHIHTSIVSRHLATRGNNKILRTPPPHISSSEGRLPASLVAPWPTQNKQISLPQNILTQSRRQNTYITTMPPL